MSIPQTAAFRAITYSHRRPAARADMPRTLGRKKPAIKNEASFAKRKRGSGAYRICVARMNASGLAPGSLLTKAPGSAPSRKPKKRRVREYDLGAHGFQLALDEALTLRGRVAAKDHIGAAIDKDGLAGHMAVVSPPAFRAPTWARRSPARAAVRVAHRQGGNNGLARRTPQLTYSGANFQHHDTRRRARFLFAGPP